MQIHKNRAYNTLLIILLSAVCCLLSITSVKANTFNPNYIISDAEILDFTSMSLQSIKDFLRNKGSFLYNYTCPNANGIIKSAAEIIYDAAVNNYDCAEANVGENPTEAEKKAKCIPVTINPKFLLVLLQKEQSLIDDPSPSQKHLDWATGYGCPDSGTCNLRWQGLGKQINSASLQFFDYMINPNYYTYKIGQTYTLTNPYAVNREETTMVTPANQATAALYNYTPHVYNGNYNFWKLWQQYFSRSYPDGSLLQAEGEVGVWLIQDGKKRPFLTYGALVSRFDPNKIIEVNKADLDAYEKGTSIRFPQYSLIRSPRGTIFLLVDDKRRGFTSGEAFRKMGFNPEEVVDASWQDINTYAEGEPITATSTYPTGALLQDNSTGGVYWVIEDTKAPLWDPIFLKTEFKNKKIIAVSPEELDQYQTIRPVIFNDGELVKSSNTAAVYVIANGKKRPIVSGKVFEGLGYKWKNIIIISPTVLYLYEEGEPITEAILKDNE